MRLFKILAPLVGALLLSVPASLEAQSRSALLQQATAALDDFDAPRAIRLARAALDPSLGPLDADWARGVHVLTQILIEEQQPELAQTWARWALRLEPEMPIDSVAFLTNVVTMLREARDAAPRSAADEATRARYEWPGVTSTATEARFRIASGGPAVTVLVRGVGLVGPQGLAVPPGSYELEVSATGFLPLRVTREALPGVAMEFSFTLTSAAAAAATLGAEVQSRLTRATVPLQVTRFGGQQACAAGLASGGERLVLTSYSAIRGADAVAANGEVRVAAWDVAANLAVLVLPANAPEQLPATSSVIDGQSLWGVTLAECRTVAPAERVLLSQWPERPLGPLELANAPAAAVGSPLVDYQGNIAGVWIGGGRAAPMGVVEPLIAKAKENIAGQRTLTPQQVATQENHRFGSVIIAVDVPNATLRVVPIEAWHWEELRAEGPAPLTFRGAAGRYRVEASAPGVTARTQEVTIRAGETLRSSISLRAVAQGGAPTQPAARKGLPKWVWAVAIGGAVGGALALGGGGGGGSSGGTIVIEVPNP
ncbi:MAG: hypothetical protein KF689_01275 [Gemmatimonadaceae bacterium]|nr:hypothetical protein [Gemmatimonadaceae bacterium]MCW5826562.1 hypothetical protein [Gemmatimonadaceae bacterium]